VFSPGGLIGFFGGALNKPVYVFVV
jgi:hypothetical protein